MESFKKEEKKIIWKVRNSTYKLKVIFSSHVVLGVEEKVVFLLGKCLICNYLNIFPNRSWFIWLPFYHNFHTFHQSFKVGESNRKERFVGVRKEPGSEGSISSGCGRFLLL